MSTYLIEQLRESLPYLEDQGWSNVAELMSAAANELERLTAQTRELEKRLNGTKQETFEAANRTHWVSHVFN
jgi:hypothetical protein